MRIALRSVLAAAALACVLSPAASGAPASPAQTVQRITVVMTEFRFALTPKTARRGTVVFTVINRGKVGHDFKIAGKKTPVLAPGKRATLRVTFTKAGRYPYLCAVPGHAAAGMKGTLIVR